MKKQFGILLAIAMLAVLVIPVSASQSQVSSYHRHYQCGAESVRHHPDCLFPRL